MPLFFLTILSVLPIVVGNELTKQHASLILLTYSIVGFFVFYRLRQIILLVTPISLIFFYTVLSLLCGAWGFENAYVAVTQNFRDYQAWQKMDISLTLILMSLTAIAAVEFNSQRRYLSVLKYTVVTSDAAHLWIGLPLLTFFFIPLNLDNFGGQGDLAIMPKTICALLVITSCQNWKNRFTRWLVYLTIIFGFSIFSIEDKRESIFLIFPIAYLELIRSPTKFDLKLIFKTTLVVLFLLLLILSMSVARGYGQMAEVDSLFTAIPTVGNYINTDDFLTGFLANIEVSYFFFHAINSVECVLNDSGVLSFGSTIAKPIFLFVPRQIAPWKPVSIIDRYTSVYDPEIRNLGGSWPISIFSEFIWNYHFFAILLALGAAKLLVRFQIEIFKANNNNRFFMVIFNMFAYMHLVTLARGSGFDQYVLYIILGALFTCICYNLHSLQSKANK